MAELKAAILLNIITFIGLLSTLFYIFLPDLFAHETKVHQVNAEKKFLSQKWISTTTEVSYPERIERAKIRFTTRKMTYHEIMTLKEIEMKSRITTYGDLNDYLCVWQDKNNETKNISPQRMPCPRKGIVSFMAGGRTANQIWEYASLWTMARMTGLRPFMPTCVGKTLNKLFEKLSIPDFETVTHCPFDITNTVEKLEQLKFSKQSFIIPRFVFNDHLVLPHLTTLIKKELVLKEELRFNAQQVLKEAVEALPLPVYTFIGVHVRRTDYIKYLAKAYNSTPVPPLFFHNAMNFYRGKYENGLFVYISDDPQWCFDQFGYLTDVVVPSYKKTTTPSEDLALMAACNHSIFDYGTFGEWGALLAGGDTVFYRTKRNIGRSTSKRKNWVLRD